MAGAARPIQIYMSNSQNEGKTPLGVRIFIILFFVLILAGIVASVVKENEETAKYNLAISSIENRDYKTAKEALGELEKPYRYPDYSELMALTDILKESDISNGFTDFEHLSIYTLEKNLEKIPDDYDGVQSKYVYDLKLQLYNIKHNYNQYYKKKEEEREKKFLEEISSAPPYVGLLKKYIDSTSLGKHKSSEIVSLQNYSTALAKAKSGDITGKIGYLYTFENTSFEALCADGKVCVISENGISKNSSWQSSKPKTTKKEEPEYDVSDFYWAEDFYDYYYDDFDSFEDAEDYFDEYSEW